MNWHAIRAIYHVRTGAHLAHAVPVDPHAGADDLALFRRVRLGDRQPHAGGRRGALWRLHHPRPDAADDPVSESIANASFGIYLPRFTGTIYELLSAPVGVAETLLGYVGAAATKSVILAPIILVTARLFVPFHIVHPILGGGLPAC